MQLQERGGLSPPQMTAMRKGNQVRPSHGLGALVSQCTCNAQPLMKASPVARRLPEAVLYLTGARVTRVNSRMPDLKCGAGREGATEAGIPPPPTLRRSIV